jgi:hypothetical protein
MIILPKQKKFKIPGNVDKIVKKTRGGEKICPSNCKHRLTIFDKYNLATGVFHCVFDASILRTNAVTWESKRTPNCPL